MGGGTLRCRLDGTGLEVYSTGTRNHLEPNLDDRDNLFTYDNTDDGLGWWTRVTHHIDGGYYGYPYDYHNRTDRMLPRMAEYGGGSPCGGVFYGEDAWPEKYRGRLFWAEWGKRAVQCLPVRPRRRDVQGRREDRLRRARRRRDFRPLDLALSSRRQDPVHRRLVAGRLGQQDREARPGLRGDLRGSRRGQDPPARQGLRPDRGPDQAARPSLVQRAVPGPDGPDPAGQGRARRRSPPRWRIPRPTRSPSGTWSGCSTRSPAARPRRPIP